MHDWQDVRVFLVAARSATLGAAAQRLGVDPATVARRVSRLETSLKATLFARSATGLKLTAAGARLLEHAMQAEAAMEAATQIAESGAQGGTLRISVAEGFGTEIVAPALPAFLQAHPRLRVELVAEAGFLSATRREVDAAVTLSAPSHPRLTIEALTDYELGLYAHPQWLAEAASIKDLTDLRSDQTIGYVDDLVYAPELRYLPELRSDLSPRLTSSSIRAQKAMVMAGGGVAMLPCFLAGPELRRVLPDQVRVTRRFWLSVHHDVAQTTRGRALRKWLKALVQSEREALMPREPASPF